MPHRIAGRKRVDAAGDNFLTAGEALGDDNPAIKRRAADGDVALSNAALIAGCFDDPDLVMSCFC